MNLFLQALENTDIPRRIKSLERKSYSDVVDVEGYQYVDLIQGGSGTNILALAGYTYVLEQVGIRFFSMAGSSAASINTILLSALQECYHTKSEKLLDIFSNKSFDEFLDGDASITWLLDKINSQARLKLLYLLFSAGDISRILKKKLGLNPGQNLQKWLTAELQKLGIFTISDLEERRRRLGEGLRLRTGEDLSYESARLSILAADITTQTCVDFPRMSSLYWAEPDMVRPATIVRAAMATPYLFEPLKISNIPNDDNPGILDGKFQSYKNLWKKLADYDGEIPTSAQLTDLAPVCNFPINIFHRKDNMPPTRPTFGVKVGSARNVSQLNQGLTGLSRSLLNTIQQINNDSFINKHPDYHQLMCNIEVHPQINCFNFRLNSDEKINLFLSGVLAATHFLENFDWLTYKETRAIELIKINPLAYMNGVDVFRMYSVPN